MAGLGKNGKFAFGNGTLYQYHLHKMEKNNLDWDGFFVEQTDK